MKKLPIQRRFSKRQGASGKKPVQPCYKHIGALVQRQRGTVGVTQQQVADDLGWSRASVANLEAGKQRVMLHDLPILAQTLGFSIAQLLLSIAQFFELERP